MLDAKTLSNPALVVMSGFPLKFRTEGAIEPKSGGEPLEVGSIVLGQIDCQWTDCPTTKRGLPFASQESD